MRVAFIGLSLTAVLAFSGCEEGSPPAQQPAAQPAPAQPAGQTAAPATPIVEGSADQPAPGMVREKARRGMGKKGQGYGGGIVTQPISTYFQTQDRIDFSIKIPQQMKMFKAMNNNRNPKDLDEYMNKIIKPAGVSLPELNEGERYVYDPEKGELLVERPQ